MVAGAVGGSYMGMATMAAQTLSDTSAQAMRDGYEPNEALVYGMASAALEVAVSKLIGSSSQGIGRSLLGTKATNLLSKALNAVSTLPWSKSVLQAIGTRLINAAGEAAEEYLQACFDPLIRNMILDENNEISFVDEEKIESALIGALLALLLPVDSSQDTTSDANVEILSVQDMSSGNTFTLPSITPLNVPSTSSQKSPANGSAVEGGAEKPFENRQSVSNIDNPKIPRYNDDKMPNMKAEEPFDLEISELMEAFKAGTEGRRYEAESQQLVTSNVALVSQYTNEVAMKEINPKTITKITDNAIHKVPKVNVDGLTDEQNTFIQNQHKDLLKYAREHNENKEVAFVFRKDSTDKLVFMGSDDIVDFGNGLVGKGNNLFVMHNHPRNSSFSDTDIATFISSENIKCISIVKNNGGVEILLKSVFFDKKRVFTEFKRQYKKYVKTGADVEVEKAVSKLIERTKEDMLWIASN